MTFRGGIHAIAFVLAACFMGCGLSLTTTEVGADGGTDSSRDTAVDTSVDAPSLVELEVKAEEGGAKLDVDFVAMGNDESSGRIVALTHDNGTASVYELGSATPYLTFMTTSAPASLVPYPFPKPTPSKSPALLFALPANSGLFTVLDDTSTATIGDRPETSRVHGSGKRVYLATGFETATANGTKIVACPAAFPADPSCATPQVVYDAQELGGFAVSKNGLLLIGLSGGGESVRLVAFTRANLGSAFTTPKTVLAKPGTLVGAEEIVTVSDDASEVRFRAPCRANTAGARTCLFTLGR
jgi:hypothetical protein